MVNYKGIQSYCQGCGACDVQGKPSARPAAPAELVDIIYQEVLRQLGGASPAAQGDGYPLIPLGVSNRHIHLTEATFKKLFGPDSNMEVYRDLYQPGEFASKSTCLIVGPKMRPIQEVRILGPYRKFDQVEISLTDAIVLGLKAPVKDSGDLDGAAPITLTGSHGSVLLPHGAIIASRHVHMTSAHARTFGVSQGDRIAVKMQGAKSTVFENILVRVNDDWKLQLHLDTDEANAAGAVCEVSAQFIGKM